MAARFICSLLASTCLFVSVVDASAGTATRTSAASKALHAERVSHPDVRSASVIVFDEANGEVLYARKATQVVPIASITKLMTALVVLESEQPLDEMLAIAKADRDTRHGSGSRLAVGARLSRGDLLHLALMSSENRAAHALGRNYPGGVNAFVRKMNARAKALGMKHTRFADPTGLSSRNVSSAADLVKLVEASAREPQIRRYSTSPSHVVKAGRQLLEFRNTNSLVNKADWDISVQKTGYTSDAGQCLVMRTTLRDRPVVIVLLNSFGKLTRVADARRIRRWLEAEAPSSQVARR